MAKKHKGGGKRPQGGGRVTPKGTRPGRSSSPSPASDRTGATSTSGATGPSGGLPPIDLDGSFGGTEDPFDLFDLGTDPFDAPPGQDLLDDLVAGLVNVDQDHPLLVEMWGASLVGGLRIGLQPPSPFDATSPFDEPRPSVTAETEDGAEDEPPTEEEFFGGMVARVAERASLEDGARFLSALIAVEPSLRHGAPEAAAAAREAITQLSRLHHAPAWAKVVGHAAVERAFVIDHETDDGHNIGLVARYPGAERPHLLMVLVDVNNGDMAKDVLISDRLDGILDEARAVAGLSMQDLELPVARARLETAFHRTDMTLDAPVSEDFDEARPMVEQLLDTLPPAATLAEPTVPPRAELEAVVDQLMDEPEVASSELPPNQLRQTASLMVQFVAQWCGRPPLSWSPARLDIFLGDFVPTKVSAPPDELQHLPRTLTDLVPAAHRLQGWADRYLPEALDAIEQVTPLFRERLAEPDEAGPAKQMMLRALAEGIDVEDPDQLAALMARVNAMGGVDAFASGEDVAFPADSASDSDADGDSPSAGAGDDTSD